MTTSHSTRAATASSGTPERRTTIALAALYCLMFERATPDFIPSDDSRMAGLTTFEMLAARIADWQPDRADPAPTAHLVWAAMHGLVSIELMHRRWGGPLVAHLQGDPEQNYARAVNSLIAGLDRPLAG